MPTTRRWRDCWRTPRREAEEVRLACRQAGPTARGRVIDIGCGPLGATQVFAEIVGESGFVAGVGQSKDALAVARRARFDRPAASRAGRGRRPLAQSTGV